MIDVERPKAAALLLRKPKVVRTVFSIRWRCLRSYYRPTVHNRPESVNFKPVTTVICAAVLRFKLPVIVIMFAASVALAKEPKHFQTGKLLQMDSVPCGTAEKDAKSLAGEMLGTDSGSKKTQEVLCQEYVLQAEKVIYRFRPHDEKHPVLLPVGEQAQFRLEKDKLILSAEDLDGKEREYVVVSMTPRSDSSTANASARTNQ